MVKKATKTAAASGSGEENSNNFDVLIIGAGISGINAGYRLQTHCHEKTYAILENRFDLGGTWDLFRYPGIRSDSDLHTFGFPWHPWKAKESIAEGQLIQDYIRESAELFNIDKKIKYGHRLVSGNWSSEQQRWRLEVVVHNEDWSKTENKIFYTNFIIFGTGYYDYEEPLSAEIPGIDNFKGTVIHPQFWPKELDYTGKKMVIIGSGATAITLLPVVAEKTEKVTMLQRSPGYIITMPQVETLDQIIRAIMPTSWAHALIRLRFILMAFFFFTLCRAFPNLAKKVLKQRTEALLPDRIPHDPHFKPKYNPWEQRVCICPDGDFFKALREGKADIATGVIDTVKEHSVVLKSGQEIEGDIIVTATGLKLRMGGGAKMSVDGKSFNFGDHYIWRGVLVQSLPNAAVVVGYTNASWTLGADAAARHICRILNTMSTNGQSSVVPTVADPDMIKPTQMLNLNSSYLVRGQSAMPKAGDQAPWQSRKNYFIDMWQSKRGDLTNGLKFYSIST